MAFADPAMLSRLRGLAAAAAMQCALLLAAASAFGVGIDRPVQAPSASIQAMTIPLRTASADPEPINAQEEARPDTMQDANDRRMGATSAPRAAASNTPTAMPTSVAAPVVAPLVPQSVPPQFIEPIRNGKADAEIDPLAAYAAVLRQRIMAWRPGGLSGEGVVVLTFRLDTSGQMTQSAIARSSGNVRLDRTALRMLRRAAPFDPPPADIGADRLAFTIEVNFH